MGCAHLILHSAFVRLDACTFRYGLKLHKGSTTALTTCCANSWQRLPATPSAAAVATVAAAPCCCPLLLLLLLLQFDWEVVVLDDPTVNAFVLPGGKIVVFTGESAVAECSLYYAPASADRGFGLMTCFGCCCIVCCTYCVCLTG
jgi:hypothetical protein